MIAKSMRIRITTQLTVLFSLLFGERIAVNAFQNIYISLKTNVRSYARQNHGMERPMMIFDSQAVAATAASTSTLLTDTIAATITGTDAVNLAANVATEQPFLSTTSALLLSAADAASFLNNSDVWVFVVGCIPFIWATIEFWRRIAVGESFGTGSDSVVIGEDNNPSSSRGRRVLGKDALIVAYFLFGISAAVVALVLYTVITNDPLPAELPAVGNDMIE